jgi:hypothetical protein
LELAEVDWLLELGSCPAVVGGEVREGFRVVWVAVVAGEGFPLSLCESGSQEGFRMAIRNNANHAATRPRIK